MNVDFSIDQPFGIKLYPYFEYAYQIVSGRPAASFVFTPGVTPLSTNKEGKKKKPSQLYPFESIAQFALQSFLHVLSTLFASSVLSFL
jgi:hypothetical protein